MTQIPDKSFDIIGDIHGHAEELKQLLALLGYRESGSIFSHPKRRVLFLGDLIDRGPEIRQTLALVRAMVESGNALCLMGNHEYNALMFATPDPRRPGEYLRSHNAEHLRQHGKTLEAFSGDAETWQDHLRWFKTLPLFLDFGNFRAVHAAWDPPSILELEKLLGFDKLSQLAARPGIRAVFLNEDFLLSSARRGQPGYDAIQNTLKGLEAPLPEGLAYDDKDGHPRRKIRLKWWLRPGEIGEFSEFALGLLSAPEEVRRVLSGMPLPETIRRQLPGVDADASPVFMGHYWMDGRPALLSPKTACLDYSVALGGKLAAYRFDGEKNLDETKLHWVESRKSK